MEHLEREVDPDGGPVVGGEELVDVAFDDGRLAGAELADDQDLVQVLELVTDLRIRSEVRIKRVYHAIPVWLSCAGNE